MEPQPNPALIQPGDTNCTPLFLIHDAGGGILSCLKLQPLDRPVYAIYNLWFRNNTKWEGGTMMFVKKYIQPIKSVVPRGDILVGGWSLGGQLGIDIGRVLALDKKSNYASSASSWSTPSIRTGGRQILLTQSSLPSWS